MTDRAAEFEAMLRDGFDPERFIRIAATVGHGKALAFGYGGHGEDWIELSLPWRQELVARVEEGVMASGAIVSLIDMAGGTACWLRIGRFVPLATIDLRVDYLRAASRGETVMARVECYRATRSVGFVRGTAHGGDPARPIAQVAATYMFNP